MTQSPRQKHNNRNVRRTLAPATPAVNRDRTRVTTSAPATRRQNVRAPTLVGNRTKEKLYNEPTLLNMPTIIDAKNKVPEAMVTEIPVAEVVSPMPEAAAVPITTTKYYAVTVGRTTGIFRTHKQAEESYLHYKGAKHKSFKRYQDAKQYMQQNCVPTATYSPAPATVAPKVTTEMLKPNRRQRKPRNNHWSQKGNKTSRRKPQKPRESATGEVIHCNVGRTDQTRTGGVRGRHLTRTGGVLSKAEANKYYKYRTGGKTKSADNDHSSTNPRSSKSLSPDKINFTKSEGKQVRPVIILQQVFNHCVIPDTGGFNHCVIDEAEAPSRHRWLRAYNPSKPAKDFIEIPMTWDS